MPEFAAGSTGGLGVNVGAPGRALARCAATSCGDDAGHADRDRPTRSAPCRTLLRDALDEGAVGFSSSQLDMHVDQDGGPVPSNLAAPDELVALAAVFADVPHGVDRVHQPHEPRGPRRRRPRADARDVRGVRQADEHQPDRATSRSLGDGWARGLEFVDEARARGPPRAPAVALQQMQVFFALHDTFLFDEMAAFREVLTAGDRARGAARANPRCATACAPRSRTPTDAHFVFTWDAVKVARADEHPEWVGLTVAELGRATRAATPSTRSSTRRSPSTSRTTFTLGGSLGARSRRDDRRGRRATRQPPGQQRRRRAPHQLLRGRLLDPACSPSTCPTSSRSRKRSRRLATIPAQLYGFATAARLGAGARADLVVWDPSELGVGATRWSEDFPAGGGRFVVDAKGYLALVVNGEVVRADGVDTGARPGRVLRPGS